MNRLSALSPILLLLALAGCGKDGGKLEQEVAIPGVEEARQRKAEAEAEAARAGTEVALADYPKVAMTTSRGRLVIELYDDKAPATVRNFLAYAGSGHYNGTVFHRVIGDLLVQGGAYTPDYRIKAERGFIRSESENGLKNLRGTVAAARRGNDANSAGAQFFINVVDNPQFDFVSAADANSRGYTVFGRVVEGMDVVDGMRSVPVQARAGIGDAAPKTPIVISDVRPLD